MLVIKLPRGRKWYGARAARSMVTGDGMQKGDESAQEVIRGAQDLYIQWQICECQCACEWSVKQGNP